MKKTISFLIFLTFLLVNFSCEFLDEDNTSRQEELSTIDLVVRNNLEQTAKYFTELIDSEEYLHELSQFVKKSINFGLDEEVRLKELHETTSAKIISKEEKLNSLFIKRFQNDFSSNFKSKGLHEIFDFINCNNVQIYWPYSEYWNGYEFPVITYDPMTNAESNIGFKLINNPNSEISIETITVDEEYAKKHPVLIVNINRIKYDDLPDFVSGKYAKNNVLYVQKENVKELKSVATDSWDDPNKTHEIQMGYIKCSYQWDFFWNGGPDFMTKWIGVNLTNLTADYSGDYVATSLTRTDVYESRWIRCYQPTNNNWEPSETENYYLFYEDDYDMSNQTITGSLKVDTEEVKFSIPYGNSDEKIKETVWSRSSYRNQTLGIGDPNAQFMDGWRIFSNNNTWWTIPFVVR